MFAELIALHLDADDRLAAAEETRLLNDRLEARLAERSAALRLYEDIVQSDNAPICAFDRAYRLIAFNPAHSEHFFRIYGHRVRIGDVFPDLFLPEQAAVIRGFMARALAGEAFTVTEAFGDPALARPVWEVAYNPLRTRRERWWARSTTRSTFRPGCGRRRSSRGRRRRCGNRRRWRRWASSPADSRTISTTC